MGSDARAPKAARASAPGGHRSIGTSHYLVRGSARLHTLIPIAHLKLVTGQREEVLLEPRDLIDKEFKLNCSNGKFR